MISCPLLFGKVWFVQALPVTWLKSNTLPRYSQPLMKKLNSLIDSFASCIIRWLVPQTVLFQASRSWELPCGIDSLSWFVLYMCIWIWFYWIDFDAHPKSFPIISKPEARCSSALHSPEERCWVTGIGWWILEGPPVTRKILLGLEEFWSFSKMEVYLWCSANANII